METRKTHSKEWTLTREDRVVLDHLWRRNPVLYEALEESIFQCYFRMGPVWG